MKTYQLVRVVTYVRYVQAKNAIDAQKQLDKIMIDSQQMALDGWEDHITECKGESAEFALSWQDSLDSRQQA